jgi:hypothetical protein
VALLAGQDYPNSYAELRAWFNEDWKCLDYLDWLRWPEGFVCPWCASPVVNVTAVVTLNKTDLSEQVGRPPLALLREIDRGLRHVLDL